MPLFRYYISASPSDPSPAEGQLHSHESDSRDKAVGELIRRGSLPPNWETMWIHFLVWVDQEGKQRGFESMPLAKFLDQQDLSA
jgi:hypothetical protein